MPTNAKWPENDLHDRNCGYWIGRIDDDCTCGVTRINEVIFLCRTFHVKAIAEKDRAIKVLEKKLEMSQYREERLCGNHKAKLLGKKTGCIACDVEIYKDKEISELKNVAKSAAEISEKQMYEIAELKEILNQIYSCRYEGDKVLCIIEGWKTQAKLTKKGE